MKSLYKVVTENKPPKWLGDAGDAVYEGMDNAFKHIGGKFKKKKRERGNGQKNALDL